MSRESLLIGGLIVTVGAGAVVLNARAKQQAALPDGLIQVNGRIEGDRISISNKYSGRIAELLAREGDTVTAGQPLIRIDDAETRARLDQARAALQMAISQSEGTGESVALTAETGDAQVKQAEGQVALADAGVAVSAADVHRAASATETARATARSARANISTLEAGVAAAAADRDRSIAAVAAAESELTSAHASSRAAESAIETARASFDRASADARRYRQLLDEQAISAQTVDQTNAAERAAKSQWHTAREQAAAARSSVDARQAAVQAAKRQTQAAEANIAQAQAQLSAAREQAAASEGSVRQMEAQQHAASSMKHEAEARSRQAAAGLSQARTAPHQVAVSRTNHAQSQARIAQARAAVRELESIVADFTVRAPAAGTVATRLVDTGEVVGAGSPLLDLVDLDRLYLKVFVPENQIGKLRLGLTSRIYVDAFPDRFFDAEVRYIASTAEFTPKEVQTADERAKLVYAVKLYVKANPQRALTPGMPADAMIRWKEDVPWKKPRW